MFAHLHESLFEFIFFSCGSNIFPCFLIISHFLSIYRLLRLSICLSLSVFVVWVQWVTRALLCRCGERSTTETFLGSDMVRWLQSVGLAGDQGEALAYGSRLLEGGVIQHISLEHGFQDEALHYRFR